MALVKLSKLQNRTKCQGSGAGTYREEKGGVDQGKKKTERMTKRVTRIRHMLVQKVSKN